jgi:hypothetical protein
LCSSASTAELGDLVVDDLVAFGARDAIVGGKLEIEPGVLGPGAAVLDVVREALLSGVQVDGGDALARFQQRDGDMHGDGGLAGATLFIAKHNDVGGTRPPRILKRHGSPSRR